MKTHCSDCDNHHVAHFVLPKSESRSSRVRAREILVVKGGRRAYVWVGGDENQVLIVQGAATLRKLARAILREVPVPKRKPSGKSDQ